jgi:hypothetical protein
MTALRSSEALGQRPSRSVKIEYRGLNVYLKVTMSNLIKFDIIEIINYRPKMNRTVIKGSAGSIITAHIPALDHVTSQTQSSVWFWQQGIEMTGDLCCDEEFTHEMTNSDNIAGYNPLFRCATGDVYDIYWSTGKMVQIQIMETANHMNFAEFSLKVILPTMYRMLKSPQ